MSGKPKKTIEKKGKINVMKARKSSVNSPKSSPKKKIRRNPANNFPTYKVVNPKSGQGKLLDEFFKMDKNYKTDEGLPIQNIEALIVQYVKKNNLKGEGFQIKNLKSDEGKRLAKMLGVPSNLDSIGDYVVCEEGTKNLLCTDISIERGLENKRNVIQNYDEKTATTPEKKLAKYPNSKGLISGIFKELASSEKNIVKKVPRPKQFMYE